MNASKVLIVDDETDMQAMIVSILRPYGFEVIDAVNGPAAIEKARKHLPDLILLDLMLPGMSGFEVCRALKSEVRTARIPIIMVTAKTDEVDRVVGLELGAEDYVTKPFSPRELLLRIRTVLRRNKDQESALLGDKEIILDRNQCRAQINGQAVDLTTTEFRLLTLLFQVTGRVLSRQQLLSQVWGERARVESRTVDTHIRRLREKMGSLAHRVETVRGFGYRLAPSSGASAEGPVYR